MDAKLTLHHDEMSEEDIQELVFSLTRSLNQETDVTASLPEQAGGIGTKGDLGVVGQIILAALSSGTVVALFQILQSYFERKPSLLIELKTQDGRELKLEAEHLSPEQIEQTLQAAKRLFIDV
ncbi:hypothetical protein KKHLCK_00390 [Candidatus Electrothrix laxa]